MWENLYFQYGFSGYKIRKIGKNVSHEAINKFQADDGNRYFFLCPNGKIDSIEIGDNRYVRYNSEEGQILFLAENAELVYISKYETEENGKNKYTFIQKTTKLGLVNPGNNDSTNKFKEEQKIKYKRRFVRDIFKPNAYKKGKGIVGGSDESKEDSFPCVTFRLAKGGEVQRPAKDVVFNKGIIKGGVINQSMRRYVFEGTEIFAKMEEIMPGEWEPDAPKKINKKYEENESILSVIGRGRHETYFSALIAYAFQVSPRFLKAFLGGEDIGEYKVYCEENNVDILIRSENKIVVIENKIDARINDEQKKDWTELIIDKDKRLEIIAEINKISSTGEHSQLEKYYKLALYYANLDKDKVKCYILCPEYRREEYDAEKGKYINGNQYEVKSYADLEEALKRKDKKINREAKDIINELKRAIQPHTIKQNTYYIEQSCGRFINRINKLKK